MNEEKKYKKKVALLIVIFIMIISILLYLDINNIPSFFKNKYSINIENWTILLIGIITEIVSGLIILNITKKQIKKENELNKEREKEIKRIDYMPIIRLKVEESEDISFDNIIQINKTRSNDYTSIFLNLEIGNIGFGAVKDCYILLKSKKINVNNVINFTESDAIPINACIKKSILLYKAYNETTLVSTIYYSDMFDNWYSQKVRIIIETTGVYSGNKELIKIRCNKCDYQLLENKPNIIINQVKE